MVYMTCRDCEACEPALRDRTNNTCYCEGTREMRVQQVADLGYEAFLRWIRCNYSEEGARLLLDAYFDINKERRPNPTK